MTGRDHTPGTPDDTTSADVSEADLSRTDALLDELASGSIDLTEHSSAQGELAALTLLRRAASPSADAGSGTAPTFVAAVRHHAVERSDDGVVDLRGRRWRRFAGTTVAAKVAIVATVTALGAAAAGATTGLARYVFDEPAPATSTSIVDPAPVPADGDVDGGRSSRVASAVQPRVRLLDDATLELLRASCARPDGDASATVRTFAQRIGSSGSQTCDAVAEETERREADGAAPTTIARQPDADEPAPTGAEPAAPTPTEPKNPNAGGANPNAGGANPNAGGANPNAGGGNPNAGGGNPNAGGGNARANGAAPVGE